MTLPVFYIDCLITTEFICTYPSVKKLVINKRKRARRPFFGNMLIPTIIPNSKPGHLQVSNVQGNCKILPSTNINLPRSKPHKTDLDRSIRTYPFKTELPFSSAVATLFVPSTWITAPSSGAPVESVTLPFTSMVCSGLLAVSRTLACPFLPLTPMTLSTISYVNG